jgi:hypothetical protein
VLVGGFLAGRQGSQQLTTAVGDLGVFVGLGSILLGLQQFMAAARDRERSVGEAPVVTQLRARLGDDFTYLRRVSVPQHGVEADGILVGPSGALVLAIRTLPGSYVVRGNDWFAVGGNGDERPLSQSPTWELARPMRSLQRAMQEHGLEPVPLQGAVVLVGGRLLSADRPGMAVVPVDRIAAYVEYLRQGTPAPGVAIAGLIDFLEPYVGGYTRGGAARTGEA